MNRRVAKLFAHLVTGFFLTGCALTHKANNGDIHRIGLFWEIEPTVAQIEEDNGIVIKKLRTFGLSIDTTGLTGGAVLGFKSWVALSVSGDSQLIFCPSPPAFHSELASLEIPND